MSRNETMPNNEFGQLIAFMTNSGVAQQDIEAIIGQNPQGRTRAEIADELKQWLKDRPKA